MPLPALKTALTPELFIREEASDYLVVVVDVFRAGSVMTTALNQGVSSIRTVLNENDALAFTGDYVLAGERNGVQLAGFDLGNSPRAFLDQAYQGRDLILTTTNGTRAIHAAAPKNDLIVGCFLNISRITNFIQESNRKVWILCSGWKGRVSLEDTLFAGALAERLLNKKYTSDCDATELAVSAWKDASSNLQQYLKRSNHYHRLTGLNAEKDIEFCLQMDSQPAIPVLEDGRWKSQ